MKESLAFDIDVISKEIFNCRECDFFSDHPKIFPDIPIFKAENRCPKAFVIGINPSFNDDTYKKIWEKSIYSAKDYGEYKDGLLNLDNQILGYQRALAETFKTVNSSLQIYRELNTYDDGFIKNIYEYVFWSNLSFCPSQNPYKRTIDGKDLACRVFEEEIPNCLDKGYLAKYIKVLEPEFLLLFTLSAKGYYYWKHIIKKLFSQVDHKISDHRVEKFTAQKRKDTEIPIEIIAAKVKAYDKTVKVLFFPHPNYRFDKEYKDYALSEMCAWFKKETA